jgi:hypothetical protein
VSSTNLILKCSAVLITLGCEDYKKYKLAFIHTLVISIHCYINHFVSTFQVWMEYDSSWRGRLDRCLHICERSQHSSGSTGLSNQRGISEGEDQPVLVFVSAVNTFADRQVPVFSIKCNLAELKGIVSRDLEVCFLLLLDSSDIATPDGTGSFFKIKSISCQIFDYSGLGGSSF